MDLILNLLDLCDEVEATCKLGFAAQSSRACVELFGELLVCAVECAGVCAVDVGIGIGWAEISQADAVVEIVIECEEIASMEVRYRERVPEIVGFGEPFGRNGRFEDVFFSVVLIVSRNGGSRAILALIVLCVAANQDNRIGNGL